MAFQLSHVEPTPNPNAFKFHTGEALLPAAASLSFPNAESAERLPLAAGLFAIENVIAVLIADDFVSVSATAAADWQLIRQYVDDNIGSYDADAGAELAATMKAEAAEAKKNQPKGDLHDRIEEVIDTYVRPALAGDGGGVELVGIDGKLVLIRYQGACGSCPTATMNTLAAIENLLRAQVDPEIVLEPA